VTLQLGVLVSGGGTNLQALIDASRDGRLDARIRVVVSNRPGAYGLERAAQAGLPTSTIDHKSFASREQFDAELVGTLRSHGVEWVALAGFMRVLSPVFLDAFAGRVLNIHPSLLPAFPGVDAQGQAFRAGVRVSGCTVHFVDGGLDSGPILVQRAVPVLAGDSEADLKARILAEEHRAYVEGLQLLAGGQARLVRDVDGRERVSFVASEVGAAR
jgi:phosphoribosylglycinamide formyltransferase-1